jgi:hypothetical protein
MLQHVVVPLLVHQQIHETIIRPCHAHKASSG